MASLRKKLIPRFRVRIMPRSMRARLLVAFVLLALLPVLVLGLALGLGGLRSFRQQVANHLASVAILKEAEISTWRSDLQFDLVLALTGEDVTRRAILLLENVQDPATSILAKGVIKSRFQQVILQTGRFEELMLIDLDGRVVFATDPGQTGSSLANQAYFHQGLQGPYLQPPHFSPSTRRASVYAARPVTDYTGEVLGVLVGRANVTKLTAIMAERTGLGLTGETYLVGSDQTLLTPTRAGVTNVRIDSLAVRRAIERRERGTGLYENHDGETVVGAYHWLPELEAVLVAEQRQDEAFRPVYTLLAVAAAIGLLGVLLAVGASLRFTRSLAAPLSRLAQMATRIAAGDLSAQSPTSYEGGAGGGSQGGVGGGSPWRDDEIGTLARAFDTMAGQLRGLIGGLEERVAERTGELDQRSRYLEAAAEVGRAAASILEADLLVQQVVDLIRREFDLYYVGLFLVDDTGEWAVLRGATGEVGRVLLARNHKLAINPLPSQGGAGGGSQEAGWGSLVGWCIANHQARVDQAGAARLATPELPDTRAEAALPLRSRGQVIGALTVHHTEAGAFRPEAVVALQTLADQVAVALDNARLFAERQEALEAAQRAYGELSREAWSQLLHTRLAQGQSKGLGYRSLERGVIAHDEPLGPEARLSLELGTTIHTLLPSTHEDTSVDNVGAGLAPAPSDNVGAGLAPALAPALEPAASRGGRYPLAIPIRVRGQVIGVLDTYKPASAGPWSPEEVALLERIVEELDPALESARLYRDTQSRAARERAIRQVTEEMRRAVDVEAILQSTVVELARALGAPRAYVRLGTEDQILTSAGAEYRSFGDDAPEPWEGGEADA